ncbi:hypothetical protein Tco_1407605 [Tanacetum coccineum]
MKDKIQTTRGEKVDTGQAVDASLLTTESIGDTNPKSKDTSSRSGNDAHADDADIITRGSNWKDDSFQTTPTVDNEPQNGSNEDITNHSELEIHDHSNEPSSSKLVPKVVPPADKTATSRQEIHKDGDGDASFQLKSDSLPHAHAQTTKTFYKHQDSRIMKAQELKTKTSAQTLIYKIFLQRYQVYQGRLLASFQDDAKYEHVGQDTRSQGGKDDQNGRIKI